MSEKSEKLYNGITNIDDGLIEAAQPKKKRRWPQWMAVAAAVLAAAVLLGVFAGRGPGSSALAVAEAKYPTMAQYPAGQYLPGFESRYDAWRADLNRQRVYFGAGDALDGFFAATAPAFLSDAGTQNRVYSPLNVYLALAMLAETTAGESRAQILSLLDAADLDSLRTQANAVWNANYRDDGAMTSILAASLWMAEDVPFRQSTLDTLASQYYASSYRGRMGSDALNRAYRDWLNAQTGGLLKDQADGKSFDPETILSLVTTIYFQAKWALEFQAARNTQDVFHAASGDETATYMHATNSWGRYFWGDRFTSVGWALKEGGDMWFVLPDEGYAPADLLSDGEALAFLSAAGDWENNKSLRVNLSLPKFDVSSQIDLAAGLNALGVTDVFLPDRADFSPLVSGSFPYPVYLSAAQHGARVVIDEEGVTAAAYTQLDMAGGAMPSEDEIDFTLDRPFLFVLTGADGLPLFLGVVNTVAG